MSDDRPYSDSWWKEGFMIMFMGRAPPLPEPGCKTYAGAAIVVDAWNSSENE